MYPSTQATDLPRDLRTLERWERWSRVADRRARWGRPGASERSQAVATRWARAWLAPARAELVARGAVLDGARW